MAGKATRRARACCECSASQPLHIYPGRSKNISNTLTGKTVGVTLQDYEPIVGKGTIEELRLLAKYLSGKVVRNVNSTFVGGGVAEILTRMVPILVELGIAARWDIIKGDNAFFKVTKKFHNALHGRAETVSPEEFELFIQTGQKNIAELNLEGDVIFVHDPQPIMLVARKKDVGKKWLWRCHIDVSHPSPEVWSFLRKYVTEYDAAVFSAASFCQPLPIRQLLIAPSIDPLSNKNKDLPQSIIDKVMEKYKVPMDKPVITQVSRFDYLKDPIGVIRAFEIVKRSVDCRLVLAGGTADDDPESQQVLSEVLERAGDNPDIHVLSIPPNSDIEINAIQRGSTIILQKSLREGFGLTVSEALWKGKPVVASAVGGIPLQVRNRLTGLLSHGIEGTAFAIKQLLTNPEYAEKLGANGKEHVRQNFLITRHVKDYLLAFLVTGMAEDLLRLEHS
ncbi:MAG: glycosyltransferase [Chloroflexi bacterium]|nr:glycosyltransferase [Chloroflexota bacterium]